MEQRQSSGWLKNQIVAHYVSMKAVVKKMYMNSAKRTWLRIATLGSHTLTHTEELKSERMR